MDTKNREITSRRFTPNRVKTRLGVICYWLYVLEARSRKWYLTFGWGSKITVKRDRITYNIYLPREHRRRRPFHWGQVTPHWAFCLNWGLSVGKLPLGVKGKGLSRRIAGMSLGSGVDFQNQWRYEKRIGFRILVWWRCKSLAYVYFLWTTTWKPLWPISVLRICPDL